MIKSLLITLTSCTLASTCHAGIKDFSSKKNLSKEEIKQKLVDRKKHSQELSSTQDELGADVQELIEAQTDAKVITLLEEAEELMAGVTDNLAISDTGKETLFKETSVIEKIFEAAKQKSKSQSGSPESKQNMADMLKQLQKAMGGEEGEQKGGKPGEKAGNEPGEGGGPGGTTDEANEKFGSGQGSKGARKLPKNSGTSPSSYPSEYQKIIEAYTKKAPVK